MGYTHYWYQPKAKSAAPSAGAWGRLIGDVQALIMQARKEGIALGDGLGEGGALEIDSDRIWFNGVGDGAHETFNLERRPVAPDWDKGKSQVFNFCKTARKPYDAVVCGALILARWHLAGKISISSDGDMSPGEWPEGVALLNRSCGRGVTFSAVFIDGALQVEMIESADPWEAEESGVSA